MAEHPIIDIQTGDGRARLASTLFPLQTPIAELPIAGYARPGQRRQRPAAVLVALLQQPRAEVVLTVRSQQLAKHPGQIAFPGGARDAEDQHVVDTALREAEEE
ncbi:MAG: NUDIX domain-containing protein, partial [Pseudomonadota bacterium]